MPWSALGEFSHRSIPPRDGDQWRINFSRVEWKVDDAGKKIIGLPEDNWVWSPQLMIDMHQPELWGYVQFSRKTDGVAPFVRDETWSARLAFYQVYRAEKRFFTANGRYTGSLPELGLSTDGWLVVPKLELTGEGYTASASSGARVLHMDQGSRIW
jgi:hypothetical protein